eukprot:CAMPEP_0194388640 /NCGR_PEP_ID=MMETSP0174-20130528/99651_1 /TAXON_ID=216777 /ORGANISM="Proboscia alata, Strain PI-D3" /LENGTH=145 /DNA_ID=CAMNT_0039180123 /DNA_START=12 /DNA_END=445 /DNA_ORIENTATION=+
MVDMPLPTTGVELQNTHTCDNCYCECKPLRCTACRLVVYCSRACQRAHWKAGHDRVCRRVDTIEPLPNPLKHANVNVTPAVNGVLGLPTDDKTVAAASLEFQRWIAKMPLERAHSEYQRMQEEISVLTAEASERRAEHTARNKVR